MDRNNPKTRQQNCKFVQLLLLAKGSLNAFRRIYNSVTTPIPRSRQIRRRVACSSRCSTSSSCLPAARDGPTTGRPRTSVAGTLARPVQVSGQASAVWQKNSETQENCKRRLWNAPAHKGLSRRRSETGTWNGTAPVAPDRPSGLARRCRAAAGRPIGPATARIVVGTCNDSDSNWKFSRLQRTTCSYYSLQGVA